MKIKRNDPCHCGSGKKYKQCCLKKDELSKQKETASQDQAKDLVAEKEDKEIKFWQDYYKSFADSDFKSRLAIIEDAFNDSTYHEDEIFFELFTQLYSDLSTSEERQIYYDLGKQFKNKLPEQYEKLEHYILRNCIFSSLLDGDNKVLEELFKELCQIAYTSFDEFIPCFDQIAYYDNLSLLTEGLRLAWPKVQTSAEIVSWGIKEYADKAMDYEIFSYLSNTSSPDWADKGLRESLELYNSELADDSLKKYLANLSGITKREWTMSDFTYGSKKQKDNSFEDNVICLANEFMDYAYKSESFSYPKVELVRTEMKNYIIARVQGELEESQSFSESGKPAIKQRTSFDHVLCPDKITFERFLGKLLGFMGNKTYRALVCYEAIPAWLRFLQAKSLIDNKQYEKSFLDNQQLMTEFESIFKKGAFKDDYLYNNLNEAWK